MHWNILDQKRISLLKRIVGSVDIGEYYMAGGTALSLQLGLGKSVDFDFFVRHKFNPHSLYAQLKDICPDNVTSVNIDDGGTCDAIMQGVQVSFFEYPYKVLYGYSRDQSMPELAMASINDIAAMKAFAIGSRGAMKDFFDLYQIYQQNDYDTQTLIHDLYMKYGQHADLSYIGMGLNYFEDAEQEKLPETYVAYDWKEIKGFFAGIQQEFFREISLYQKSYEQDGQEQEDDLER